MVLFRIVKNKYDGEKKKKECVPLRQIIINYAPIVCQLKAKLWNINWLF